MKNKVLMIVCVLSMYSQYVGAENKFDPYLNLASNSGFTVAKSTASGVQLVSVIIKTTAPEKVRSFILHCGGFVHTEVGGFIIAEVPAGAIAALSEQPFVVYVEASKPLKLNLDKSSVEIGANLVRSGLTSGTPYTGKGVIVGIIDSGIDWSHHMFKDEKGQSRIISIWDQTVNGSAGFVSPSEVENSYGIECVKENIDNENCPSIDNVGHGTHVAGIAAGRDPFYMGIAPDAELVVVKAIDKDTGLSLSELGAFSNNILDGVNYIFKKAAELGKPAVINISMGTNLGAHDGSSLFESVLNGLLDESSGRSVVVSAGNNNNLSKGYVASIHSGAVLTGETVAFEFHNFVSTNKTLILDVWQGEDSSLSFGLGVDNYSGYERTEMVSPGGIYDQVLDNGKIRIVIDSSEVANPLNNKKHTVISILPEQDGVTLSDSKYVFDLIVNGSGSFDAWTASGGVFVKRTGTFPTGYSYLPGDSQYTIGVPSTAKNVISVASYSSREDFGFLSTAVDVDEIQFTTIGEISPFSSFGPTKDVEKTGQKPEITAPGEWIISALSKDAENEMVSEGMIVDSYRSFVAMQGTSMAAPHVTGAVALLFEKDAQLSFGDVKMLLDKNTKVDDKTGALPNNQWGYGKLDISKAIKNFDATDLTTPLALASDDISEIAFDGGTEPVSSSENSNGGGGCSLAVENGSSSSASLMLLVLLSPCLFLLRSVRKTLLSIILLSVVLCSCGGSGTEGPLPDVDLSPAYWDSNVKQSLEIDTSKMMAVYSSVDADKLTGAVLIVPLEHFISGEKIEAGSDNYFARNSEQALLVLSQFEKTGDKYNEIERWVSVAGIVSLEDVAVNESYQVSISLENVVLRRIDVNKGIIERDGEEGTFFGQIKTLVTSGTSEPIIISVTPESFKFGDIVTVKGFNLNGGVKFGKCGSDLPFETISVGQIEVLMNSYCDDDHLYVGDLWSGAAGWYLPRTDEGPSVNSISLPSNQKVLKTVLNNDLLYLLFDNEDQIYVYSLVGKTFLEPINIPTAYPRSFDITADGKYLAVGSSNKIYLLDHSNNDNLIKTFDMPAVSSFQDIAFGPGNMGLVSITPQTLMGVLNVSNLEFTVPDKLKLTGAATGYSTLVSTPDRELLAAYGTAYSSETVGIYRFSDTDISLVSSIVLPVVINSRTKPLFNTVDEEVWIGSNIYDYNLNLKTGNAGISGVSEYVDLIASDRLFFAEFRDGGYFDIYDPVTGKALVGDVSFDRDMFSSIKPYVLVSQSGGDMLFVLGHDLYDVDFKGLNDWLVK